MKCKPHETSEEVSRLDQRVYKPCGYELTQLRNEPESSEYGASQFRLNDLKIHFRKAKTTPTKIGQFVTFWKRSPEGPIAPFESVDVFDFLIVSVVTETNAGQFLFPKSELQKRDILSQNSRGGKRALRVYPPWDKTLSPQAQKTQKWQLLFFHDVPLAGPIDLKRAKELLKL